jgi:hypothetical protein
MSKVIKYSIQCYPAEIAPASPGILASCSFLMFDPKMTRHEIETHSLDVLQAGVRDIAKESKQDACIMISWPRGERKPRGFDAACDAVRWIKYRESSNAE